MGPRICPRRGYHGSRYSGRKRRASSSSFVVPRTETWVDFAGHAVVGLVWLVSRQWAIGVEVRPYVLSTSMSDQPPRPADPVWVTAVLRAQMLFEI